MIKVITCTVLFVVILYMKHILTLQVIPERALLTYTNEKYLSNASLIIKRHSRRSKYCINIEAVTLQPFDDNMTIHLIFLELQQNEYKQSFVEGHFKICEVYNSNKGLAPYVAATFRNAGFSCPVKANEHLRIMNMTVPADDFPNVWPFERCKIKASITHTPTKDIVAAADIYIHFKQTPRSG